MRKHLFLALLASSARAADLTPNAKLSFDFPELIKRSQAMLNELWG